jgi:hypothetical protein
MEREFIFVGELAFAVTIRILRVMGELSLFRFIQGYSRWCRQKSDSKSVSGSALDFPHPPYLGQHDARKHFRARSGGN